MVRTQIYLTETEREALVNLAQNTGKKQSELIREAIDQFIERSKSSYRETILKRTAGIWKDRNDLPDFGKMRAEWDRMMAE